MIVNLIERCEGSLKKEFYYGALMNKEIKDVYLGYAYLEPKENRDYITGENHEEIIMPLNGEMKLRISENEIILKKGDAYFLRDGLKLKIENLTDAKVSFVIAGGHPVPHSHDHH
ncbi:MAG: hypothetical protein ACFFDN_08855 [Candidatus Hodarchaeota archaeon]